MPPIIVDVYVDDLIMLGPKRDLGEMLLRVRRHVDMEDPHKLGKYFGCYHRVRADVDPKTGATITEVEWDMIDYNKSAVVAYERDGFDGVSPVSSASTPFAPKLDGKRLDELLEKEGGFAATARVALNEAALWVPHCLAAYCCRDR